MTTGPDNNLSRNFAKHYFRRGIFLTDVKEEGKWWMLRCNIMPKNTSWPRTSSCRKFNLITLFITLTTMDHFAKCIEGFQLRRISLNNFLYNLGKTLKAYWSNYSNKFFENYLNKFKTTTWQKFFFNNFNCNSRIWLSW